MVAPGKQQMFLNELCERLGKSKDSIFDLALCGELPLWIGVHDMYLFPQGYQLQYANNRIVYPPEFFFSYAEIKLDMQTLTQMKEMNGPMLIVSELSCSNEDNEQVTLVNMADETYGETSLIGINMSQLFAKINAVKKIETQGGQQPGAETQTDPDRGRKNQSAPSATLNARDHVHHAEELSIAVHCWQSLFENTGSKGKTIKKSNIKSWIAEHYPSLSAAATDRIATVVTPLKK